MMRQGLADFSRFQSAPGGEPPENGWRATHRATGHTGFNPLRGGEPPENQGHDP